jgi:hypothetical protein
MEELNKYYSLDEVRNRGKIIKRLSKYEDDGKIEFTIDGDLLTLEDLNLDINEINDLRKFLEANDAFVDLDLEDDDKLQDLISKSDIIVKLLEGQLGVLNEQKKKLSKLQKN